jgi:hypothetical protein
MTRSLDDVKASVLSINGADLLDEVRDFVARFIAFPSKAALDAVTLWAVMTHMSAHLHTTPRLALLSPEAGSGKTRVLEVLALLVASALLSFGASAASIFRTLAKGLLTLLFDECDALFTKRGKDDQNEDLRALLNVGYRRGAKIPRCVGPRHDVELFDVFAPAALAGLGDLPDTIMTRSIIVRMRKRSRGERIAQFRLRMHEAEGASLRERLAAWAADVGQAVGEAWPQLPEGVEDRQAECWEPLIAIADAAGGHWPETARAACVELLKVAADREVSLGVRLLADLRDVFGDRDAVATADILEALNGMEESPWGDLDGRKLDPRRLALMLRRYEVSSTKVRPRGEPPRQGYRREDLWDSWQRYLPEASAEAEHPEHARAAPDSRVPDDMAPVPLIVPAGVAVPEQGGATVPHVPERQPGPEHTSGVVNGDVPVVPDVPDARETGRAPGANGDLGLAAAELATELRPLGLEAWRDRHRLAAPHAPAAPGWWVSTAITEPLVVAIAVELLARDQLAGAFAGRAHVYLAAARAAVAAQRDAPGGP